MPLKIDKGILKMTPAGMCNVLQVKSFAMLFPVLFLVVMNEAFSQEVEHNYKVGPQITTCDSLVLEGSTTAELIKGIESTKFRFDQTFRLTRKQGLKSGSYYSCDNREGFLVIEYNDQTILYKNIERTSWDAMIRSSDPEGYYLKMRNEWDDIP